ncbi:MAG: c-type cytochrome [Acetobacteraceae bacterium]|nr:c-type cytochrome [Acetobacteraceae bacterium]
MKPTRRWAALAVAGLVAALGSPAVGSLTLARADDATVRTGEAIVAHGVSPERPGCAACHMQDGAGQPEVGIPRLAGLTGPYIAAQLEAFATGARRNAAMSPYAAMLTPAQRQAVTDYIARLPVPPQADPLPVPARQRNHGRTLFLDGDYRTGLLACAQCHGQTGLGVGAFSPRLAGQSAAYVAEQLRAWHANRPRDAQDAFMRSVAGRLTPSDIEDVAAFVASLGEKESGTP